MMAWFWGAEGHPSRCLMQVVSAAGLEMLQEVANVDCSYNLTPEQLYEKVAVSDALIVRSATKVRPRPRHQRNETVQQQ